MCLNPIRLPKLTGTNAAVIPCGKCAECLRNKANQLAVRSIREVENFGNFFFLTFTYNDESVPIAQTSFKTDPETGEVSEKPSSFHILKKGHGLTKKFFTEAPRCYVTAPDGKVIKRPDPLYYYDGDDYSCLYYSLDNEDFKKMMKRARIKRQRANKPLPDFKYLCVGEYGGVTYRPHFHCLFFGLKRADINYIAEIWERALNYGHVDIREVAYSTEDMSKVARYVAGYAEKGKYDCPHIFEGLCRKPRKMQSLYFGIGNGEDYANLESWLKCEDIYGTYDPDDKDFIDLNPGLIDDVISRRYYEINGFKYPLPTYIKRKIFFKKHYDEREKKQKVAATELQKLATAAILKHIVGDIDNQARILQTVATNAGENCGEALSTLVAAQKTEMLAIEKDFITKIKSSIL